MLNRKIIAKKEKPRRFQIISTNLNRYVRKRNKCIVVMPTKSSFSTDTEPQINEVCTYVLLLKWGSNRHESVTKPAGNNLIFPRLWRK